MFRTFPTPARLFSLVMVLSGIAACFCTGVSGQTAPVSDEEINEQAKRIRAKAFVNCEGTYYLGTVPLPQLSCIDIGETLSDGPHKRVPTKCEGITKYNNATFEWLAGDLTPADYPNGIEWRGYIRMDYSWSQSRHIADGVWGPWERALDLPEAISYIFQFEKKNGIWSEQLGPDFIKLPLSIDWLVKGRPSCSDILNANAHPGRELEAEHERELSTPHGATGHSLKDNYLRTVEIINDNKARGIPDAIAFQGNYDYWLSPHTVCSSMSEENVNGVMMKRKCTPSGETVRVPGDLAVPDSFWQEQPRRCFSKTPDGVEVSLNEPYSASPSKKRLLGCADIASLAARRQHLMALGIN